MIESGVLHGPGFVGDSLLMWETYIKHVKEPMLDARFPILSRVECRFLAVLIPLLLQKVGDIELTLPSAEFCVSEYKLYGKSTFDPFFVGFVDNRGDYQQRDNGTALASQAKETRIKLE